MKRRDFLVSSLTASAVSLGQSSAAVGGSAPATREWKFERVAGPFSFGEGPVWDGKAVLFTDIPNSRVLRFDYESGGCSEYRNGTNRANGLMPAIALC